MRNPFRTESTAFRFLLVTLAAFAAVAVANAAGGATAALAVWIAVTVAVLLYYLRRRRARPIATAPAHAGAPAERRLLVVAERIPEAAPLAAAAEGVDRVLVVAPAHVAPLREWASDVDSARERAARRRDAAVGALREAHVEASGVVGDGDAVLAVEDALRTFGGDEIVVATDDEEVVARLRERYALPVSRAGA